MPSNLRSSIRHVDYKVQLTPRGRGWQRRHGVWLGIAISAAAGALIAAYSGLPGSDGSPAASSASNSQADAGFQRERRVITLPAPGHALPASISELPGGDSSSDPAHAEQPPEPQRELEDGLVLGVPEGDVTPDERETGQAGQSDAYDWHDVTVERGDSLAGIFSSLGLSATDLHHLVQGEEGERLARIKPGQELQIGVDDDRVEELVLHEDRLTAIRYRRDGDSFTQEREQQEPERRTRHAEGTIERSLFLAGQRAGLSDRLIMELTDIFAWDIDFMLDIRQGDQFYVIYEELYHEDEHIGDGRILAAEFNNREEPHRAVHFEDPDGRSDYYTPEGRSVRRAFIRTPVEFTRISSHFGPREHPVLHTRRQHKGVDYAAPTGTPIKAAGDGVVTHVGRKGGYGKAVQLKHGQRYSTLYAHMSRTANLSVGQRVEQGKTIGYVGQSGFATGPHLHYEFLVDGQHKDPVKVDLPEAEPIDPEYRQAFERAATPLLARLDNLRETHLAQRDE